MEIDLFEPAIKVIKLSVQIISIKHKMCFKNNKKTFYSEAPHSQRLGIKPTTSLSPKTSSTKPTITYLVSRLEVFSHIRTN